MRVREGSPSSTSNVDDNGDMEAGVYEAQEQDLPLKEITPCDEDDVTRTCIRDLAAATKSCLGYHPGLKPPPATEAAVTCAARGLAPFYGFSRTTKSLSPPKSPQHQLQSSDLSHPPGAN